MVNCPCYACHSNIFIHENLNFDRFSLDFMEIYEREAVHSVKKAYEIFSEQNDFKDILRSFVERKELC